MNIKQVAINLISEVDKGGYSNIVLNENFKKLNLNRKEKSFITEIFYGVLRNKTFLDYLISKRVKEIKKEWIRNLLRISFYQIIYMRTDNMGVVWEAVELTKKKYGVPVSKFINATLRKFLLEKENISIDEVVSFGDGENDFELLTEVGCGYAMGNAIERLKNLLPKDFLTVDKNSEDGEAKKLVELFLSK